MNLGYYIGQSYVIAKGQLILKADWHTIDSPKKWTDEFVLFAFYSSRQTNQIRQFVLGRIYGSPICFSVLSDL